MAKYVFIDTERTGYEPCQVGQTMTVGELAETFALIADREGDDMKVYLRNDDGYTYGGITEYDVNVTEIEEWED